MLSEKQFGLARAFLHCVHAGNTERIKTVDVATGGQNIRCLEHIPPNHRGDIATVQRVHNGVGFRTHAKLLVHVDHRRHARVLAVVKRSAQNPLDRIIRQRRVGLHVRHGGKHGATVIF